MCEQIHETVIRDIVDVISDVKKSDEVQWLLNREKSFSSIARASSNLTLVFPVLVSKNMNIENASMVVKAIERKATSMLQILFSAINISDSKNGIDYIKNFHTNLKIDNDISVDDFMDAMDKFVIQNEASISYENRILYEKVKEDLKNINFVLPDSINETAISDYKLYPSYYNGSSNIIKEAKSKTETEMIQYNTYEKDPNQYGYEGNPVIGKHTKTTTSNSSDNEVRYSRNLRDDEALASDRVGIQKTYQDILKSQILDSDVKKANELIPTMMIINYINTSTGAQIPAQMVIGIKAKMYTLDSIDIINRMSLKNKDNNGFLNVIKATTREISFFRDLVFAIDTAKLDALSQSRRGSSSKLWKILERRSKKSKLRRTLGHKNDASAISTLVVSQEEVEYLKKSENINIEDPKVIRPIMESYNLMGFCIVDEQMEVAKFIFDTGNDIYETLSFNLLERETSDNGYKKVINLMTKISR